MAQETDLAALGLDGSFRHSNDDAWSFCLYFTWCSFVDFPASFSRMIIEVLGFQREYPCIIIGISWCSNHECSLFYLPAVISANQLVRIDIFSEFYCPAGNSRSQNPEHSCNDDQGHLLAGYALIFNDMTK
jgi:hypothetical protein